jgi:hypothetical protein
MLAFEWSVSCDQDWLTPAVGGGTLPPETSAAVEICTNSSTAALPAGSYSANCRFRHLPTGIEIPRRVKLEIELCQSELAILPTQPPEFQLLPGQVASQDILVANVADMICRDLVFSASASTTDGGSPVIDTIGTGALVNYGTNRYRGNIYEVTAGTTLTGVESYLDFESERELHYVVFEGTTLSGNYQRVLSQSVLHSGTGAGFYPSNPTSIALIEGRFYIVAVGWGDENVTYYFDDAPPQSVSFGQQVHGFLTNGFPIGTTLSNPPLTNTSTRGCPWCRRSTLLRLAARPWWACAQTRQICRRVRTRGNSPSTAAIRTVPRTFFPSCCSWDLRGRDASRRT